MTQEFPCLLYPELQLQPLIFEEQSEKVEQEALYGQLEITADRLRQLSG